VLGERFSLFPPEATVQQRSVDGIIPGFQSLLTLDTDDLLPPLPFQLSTSVWPKPFHDAFTPFEPDAGYHLSREDYDPVIRPLLRQRLLHDFSQRDIPDHPLVLSVVAQLHGAAWREGPDATMTVGHLFDDYGHTLARLHLLVTVNGMRLAAAPDPHGLQNGDLAYWRDFYPTDLGPLPPAGGPNPDAGLFIALPARWDAVSQLQGRFVLPPPPGSG